MTDKEFQKQKRRVEKYIEKWQKPCGFGWWTIDVEWDRERDDENSGTIGKCWSRWQYRSGTIRFYLPVVKDNSDDEVEQAVIHELSHLLLSPLQDFSTDEKREITEYTTTLVTDALYWAHTQVEKDNDGTATKAKAKADKKPRKLRSAEDQHVQEVGAIRCSTRGTGREHLVQKTLRIKN